MKKFYGNLQFAYNKSRNPNKKKVDYKVVHELYPLVENFLINKTKWKKMPSAFNGAKDDTKFVASMLTYGPNKKLVDDIRKEANNPHIIYSHREIIDAIVFIIQRLDIDVLTIEYTRTEVNEKYKSIWDKISERGHV